MELISFHGDEDLKKFALESNESTFDSKILEESFGIPGWICQVKSLFFNPFKEGECDKFYFNLLSEIPVGVNLDRVKWKFLSYMLNECINMLKSQSGNEKFLKERDEIIPYLEKTKSFYDSFFIYRCEDDALCNFELVSRTLIASIPRGLENSEYCDIYKNYYKKLIEFFKKEDNVLFFKFKGFEKEKDQNVSIVYNEKSNLIPNNKMSTFKYLKSLIKSITK